MRSQDDKTRSGDSKPKVIVRAWGDEPVMLLAHGIEADKQRVFVGIPESKQPISLPWSHVFDFDPEVYSRLSAAYSHGNRDELARVYENLRMDDRYCNRYRNNVYC